MAEDDLGRLIRWSLEDAVSGAEPSPDVWPRILQQVKQKGAASEPGPVRRRLLSGLVPLMQAVVVSSLLLVFGLSVDRSMLMPHPESQALPTPAVQVSVVSEEESQDVLSGCILFRQAKEPLPRPSTGVTCGSREARGIEVSSWSTLSLDGKRR
ncbi:MAG: hypothetical protein FJ026_04385 [Chloroflexi bacterium]|nr:hypothetical protein [Chloroflexota bacterium]